MGKRWSSCWLWLYITSGAKAIIETPKKVTTIYNDAKTLISGADADLNHVLDRGSHTIDNIVKKTGKVVTHGQDTIGNTVGKAADSLSQPLMYAGIAVLAFLLLKK